MNNFLPCISMMRFEGNKVAIKQMTSPIFLKLKNDQIVNIINTTCKTEENNSSHCILSYIKYFCEEIANG